MSYLFSNENPSGDNSSNYFSAFVANLARQQLVVNEGDYKGEDGFLHCGVCHEPKQQYNYGTIYVKNCACQRKHYAERDAREQADEERKIYSTRRAVCFAGRSEAGLKKAEQMTFENNLYKESEASKKCAAYADHFSKMLRDNTGLYLYGNVGRGKSYLAACICNEVIDKGFTALFVNPREIANLAASVKEEEREEAKVRLTSPDLIVFDDFGTERRSDYMDEGIQAIVEIRYKANKPLVITSNKSPDELKECADIKQARVYDRIFELCQFVEVGGQDKRLIIHNEKYDRLKWLNGEGDGIGDAQKG